MSLVRSLVGIATAGMLCVCCRPDTPMQAKSSGSLALTQDDSTLYVADADHDRVSLVDTRTRSVLGHIPVGAKPERVLVADDDAVFVTSRGARSVTRIDKSSMTATVVGATDGEPVGMALTRDGTRLLVANSSSGTVTVHDAKTLSRVAEIPVPAQPWAITTLPRGEQAYVTDYNAGKVAVVDLQSNAVTQIVDLSQPRATECRSGTTAPARTPAQAADVVVAPDGERAYVAHVQTRLNAGTARGDLALAVAPALSTLNAVSDQLFIEPESTDPGVADFPATVLATADSQTCAPERVPGGMDAPSSLVVDGSGEWIYVADHNSNALAVVSATRRQGGTSGGPWLVPERGIVDVVRVGARPTGLAVRRDLTAAYVHSAFDYNVTVVESREGKLVATGTIEFATSDLPPEVDRGRRLFYSAVDPRLTRPELGGVSCSSCHPNGRTDGLNWTLPPTPEVRTTAARNTPALWGVLKTPPYHWDGMLKDMPAFSRVMVSQMGGQGLAARELQDLTSYLGTIAPPDNARAATLPGESVAAGKRIFDARCATCHSGEMLADGKVHATTGTTAQRIKTPTLRGVFATPPYLHDGSAPTLRDVFGGPLFSIAEHRLGTGALPLTAADTDALLSYLETL